MGIASRTRCCREERCHRAISQPTKKNNGSRNRRLLTGWLSRAWWCHVLPISLYRNDRASLICRRAAFRNNFRKWNFPLGLKQTNRLINKNSGSDCDITWNKEITGSYFDTCSRYLSDNEAEALRHFVVLTISNTCTAVCFIVTAAVAGK
jgi:hypothetical protein